MLKGIDKEWIHSSNNTASYTNLPAGEYEFLVCGSNNDHHWNEKAASLWIVITPPWWRTSVAYLCIYYYFCVQLAILVGVGISMSSVNITSYGGLSGCQGKRDV